MAVRSRRERVSCGTIFSFRIPACRQNAADSHKKEEELEEYFNTQLARCGVDYFDYYLMHDMGGNRRKAAEETHIFEFLAKKKAADVVKQIGFFS